MKKRINKILWYGDELLDEKAKAPGAATSADGLDGLNEGEIYISNNEKDPALFIRTSSGKVVRVGSDNLFKLVQDEQGNYYIHTTYSFASDGTVSSLGVGEDGDSIAGLSALYQLVDVLADGDKVSGAEDGNVLMYDAATGKWYGKKVNLPDVDFSDINDKFVSIDGLIESLQEKDVAHDESITALQAKDAAIEQSITSLQTKDTEHSNAIAALQTKDTAIEQSVTSLQGQLNTLVSGDASSAIESFNEVVAFLKDMEDDSTLEGILAGKQNKITETNKLDYSLIANTPSLADFMGNSSIGGTASSENFSAVYWDGSAWKTRTIYKWALASVKPSYTTSEVTEGTRLYFTDDRAKTALKSTTDALSDRIAVFEKMFQWGDGDGSHIKTPYSFASDKTVSSLGVGSDGTGGLSYDRLDSWDSYTDDKAGYVLSAALGWDLKTRLDNLDIGDFDLSGYYDKGEVNDLLTGKQDVISDLGTIKRGAALGATALQHSDLDEYVNEITTSGSGNAITSVTKSGKKLTFNKASSFFLKGNFTKANIKTTLGISDWALASSKPSYKTSEVAEDNNLYFTTERVKNYLTGAVSSVLTSDLTASRALISNASGKISVSAVTSTELGYLDGVTSAIQTQLNALSSRIKAYEDILKIEENGTLLHATVALASDSTLSSLGVGSDEGGGAGTSVSILQDWGNYDENTVMALGANLGYELNERFEELGNAALMGYTTTVVSGDNQQLVTGGAVYKHVTSRLNPYVLNSALANYVTIDGWQSITGKKSFEGGIDIYGQINGYLSDGEYRSWYIDHEGNGVFTSLKVGSYNVLHKGNTSYSPALTSGTKIGTITIGGTATDLYAPVGGGDTSALESQIADVEHNLGLLTEDFNTLNDAVGGLATVATSGDYNDLSNKPTIPSLTGYATETWVNSNFAKADAFTALNSSFIGLNYYLIANGSVGQVLTKKSGGYEWKSFYVDWSNVSSTPTTLAGYGIKDVVVIDDEAIYLDSMFDGIRGGKLFGSTLDDGSLTYEPFLEFGYHKYSAQFMSRNGRTRYRNSENGTWTSWKTILDSGNFSSYALPLSGGTLSGALTISGNVLIGTTTDNGQKLQVNGNILLPNTGVIYMRNAANTANYNVLQLESDNAVHLGYHSGSNGGDAHIHGNSIKLRYGNSHLLGLYLNSSGNVTIGSSDLAGSTYKFYVNGNANITGGVITDRVHIPQTSNIARGIATSFTDTSNDSNGIARPWYGLSFVSGDTYEQTYLSGYYGMTFRTGGTPYYFVYQGGGIRPWSNGTQNCGTTGFAWANVVAVNGIYSGSLSAGSLTVSGDILPSSTDTQSLGSTSSYWRNLYVGIITGHYQSGDVVKFSGSINANEGNVSCKSLTVNGSSLSTLITEAINTFNEENLGTAASYGVTTSVTSGSTNLVTSGGVASALSGYVSKSSASTIAAKLTVNELSSNGSISTGGSLSVYGNITISIGGLTAANGTVSAKTITQTSDERLKSLIGDVRLSLGTMACAPLKKFHYHDDGLLRVGTLAQYWQGALPEVVSTTPNGTLALAYGELGVAMGISLANHLTELKADLSVTDDEVTKLKKRVEELENENKRLQERVDALVA